MEPRLTAGVERRALPRDPTEVRRLLASIVESSEDAIYAKDLNGVITSWNASAQRLYGYSPEEIVGRSQTMLVPPELGDEFLAVLHRLRAGQGVQHYETVRIRKDQRRIPVSLTISPIRDESGQIVGASTIARDLSTRRMEESRWRLLAEMGDALNEVLDAEKLVRELANVMVPALADYCITYLVEGDRVRRVGIAHADPAQLQLLHRLYLIAPPQLSDSFGAGKAIRTGEVSFMPDLNTSLVRQTIGTGEYFEIIRSLSPISSMVLPLGARGRMIGAIALTTTPTSGRHYSEADLAFGREVADRAALSLDKARLYGEAQAEIARREAAEETLSRRYEALRALYQITDAVGRAAAVDEIYKKALDGLNEALDVRRASILLFDPDGVLRFKASRGLSERYRAQVEGHTPWSPDTQNPAPIAIRDVAATTDLEAPLKANILAEGIKGMAFFPLTFGRQLLGKFMLYFDQPRELTPEELELAQTIGGNVGFAIAKARDEQSVREAKSVAERASEAKSQFLGIMSHELRTPLNAVLGYGDLLLLETRGPLTDGQREQVERIKASAHHQLGLVEELLTYTRLEAGREEARLVETDARRIVTDVAELIRPQAEGKGLKLRIDLPEAPISIITDPAKLRQIALNLAGNAAKYTDSGEIAIRAQCGDEHFELSVEDTGVGISPEKLEYIFEPFAQVDQTRTRVAGGTGLGLAIARRFGDLLGGTISVQSRVGLGSTFTLTIPNACIEQS